jgi:hypothetical protein
MRTAIGWLCLLPLVWNVGCDSSDGAQRSGPGGTGAVAGNASTGGAGGSTGGAGGSTGGSGGVVVTPILHVDFDASPLGAYTDAAFEVDWPSGRWVSGLDQARAEIVDGADAFAGRSLRVKYPTGSFGPDENAIQFWIDLPQSYDELFVAYRVRFGPGFDFVRGGKLPGLLGGNGNTGGEKPTGTDGFSARMMWRGGGDAVQYVYHVDQPTIYGEDFPWSRTFVAGTWHTVEHRVVMNTPGENDGVVQGFWDGQLSLDRQDVRFRDVTTFAIDGFYFSTFFGGSDATWAATKDEWIYFDEIVVSSAPITH